MVFSLVRSHTVHAHLHCIVWLDNVSWSVSPLIPIRPAPASQHNTTAVPEQSLWLNVLENTVCAARLCRPEQGLQVLRDYEENISLRDPFFYPNEYLLAKVTEGQSESSYQGGFHSQISQTSGSMHYQKQAGKCSTSHLNIINQFLGTSWHKKIVSSYM